MHTYAQTNIQLYRQLIQAGYQQEDLVLIRKGYDLAMRLFAGRFQSNGKDFIAHDVGTASILASLHMPAEIVTAGLIHNVYRSGDFGDGKHEITERRRDHVRQAVSPGIESIVARFNSFLFGEQALPLIQDCLSTLSQLDRTVVLLYLADNLEHSLDYGCCYYSPEKQRYYCPPNRLLLIEIANGLGFPTLAETIARVHHQNAEFEIPQEFHGSLGRGFTIPPSCRKRLSLVLYQHWGEGFSIVRRRVAPWLRPIRHGLRSVKKGSSWN